MTKYQVVIVGGGVTGAGILRDLSMRGISTLLLEQGDLAHGTSSRFHGLLHSGARYVVKDPESAVECIKENYILKKSPTIVLAIPEVGLFKQKLIHRSISNNGLKVAAKPKFPLRKFLLQRLWLKNH